MKPPSEMIVVSELLLPLLLLDALERLSFSTLSIIVSSTMLRRAADAAIASPADRSTDRSVERADEGGLDGGEVRRRWVATSLAPATLLIPADEGAMAVTDGRRSELRRAIDPPSSACFRPGEHWEVLDGSGRLSAKTSMAERRLAGSCSVGDTVVSEGTPSPCPPPPRAAPARAAGIRWGLPLEPRLFGMGTALLRGDGSPRVGLATWWLDRLEMVGAADWRPVPRTLPVGLPSGGVPLGEVGAAVMLSSMDLMSGGMGTWCTVLTAGQSAAPMSLYSLGLGGRQQPGQPGFW